jgi:hypothetical protein
VFYAYGETAQGGHLPLITRLRSVTAHTQEPVAAEVLPCA